ncbi:Protein cornichon homolog 4 [Linum grandiflorum]
MISGWVFIFFFLVALICIISFELMSLSDLEFDYVNPYDSARRINLVVLPEYITHAALSLSFLLTGHWVLCLLSLPCLYFDLTLYLQRKHLVDVTEIYNYNRLHREKNRRLIKMAYILIMLVLSLFCLLWTVLDEEFD